MKPQRRHHVLPNGRRLRKARPPSERRKDPVAGTEVAQTVANEPCLARARVKARRRARAKGRVRVRDRPTVKGTATEARAVRGGGVSG
jgi:hypothetical protein